jgi:hypothetical protein
MAKAAQEPKVSESAFIARLNKKKELLKKASNAKAQSFLKDTELISLFGLDADTSVVVTCKATGVRYGTDKNGDAFFSFNYTISEGEHEGVNLSVYRKIDTSTDEKAEKSMQQVMFGFQRLGYDTEGWTGSELVDAAKDVSKDKPTVNISLSVYQKDEKSDPRLNVNVISVKKNDDDEEPSDDEEEESEDTETEEEDSEEAEDEAEEEESEEEDEGLDGEAMVGYEVTFKPKDAAKAIKGGEITSYNKSKNTFTVTHKGKTYKDVAFDDVTIPE